MRLINTVSIALTLAAASSLAAPSSTKCVYESDKAHLSCVDAEHYARDVEVTYDMTKRSHVEQFLRRTDAIEALTRGMDEDSQLQEQKRAEVNGEGNNVGNYCNFGNGNVNGRRSNDAQFSCNQEGHPTYGPHPKPQVIGQLRRDYSQGEVKIDAAPGVKTYETNTGVNQSKGDGNNVGRVINFGMGRRDKIEGSGVQGDGNNVQNHCLYGNSGKSKRDNNPSAEMTCTQRESPIYGPNGGSVTIIGARSFSFNDVDDVVDYHIARSFLPHASPFVAREEVCSGVPVGPVGAQVTYVTRGLPTEPTQGVVEAQKRVATTTISNVSPTQPAKRCINTPIAPEAPTVSYISKADYKKQQGGQ